MNILGDYNWFGSISFLYLVLEIVVHVVFAVAVYHDSQLMGRHLQRKTFLVGGAMWALATLLGGVVIAGLYWAIHHSNLRPEPKFEGPVERLVHSAKRPEAGDSI